MSCTICQVYNRPGVHGVKLVVWGTVGCLVECVVLHQLGCMTKGMLNIDGIVSTQLRANFSQ